MNTISSYCHLLRTGLDQVEKTFYCHVVEVVLENINRLDFKVFDLSHQAGLSERQLNRRLKSLTEMTAAQLIREIKLREAEKLLLSEQYQTVSQVSRSVGFKKPGYFSEIYTNRFGKRPIEYFNHQ